MGIYFFTWVAYKSWGFEAYSIIVCNKSIWYGLLSITLKEKVCEKAFLGPIWCFVNGYHDNNLKSNWHIQVRKLIKINLAAQSHFFIDSFILYCAIFAADFPFSYVLIITSRHVI